MPSGLRWPDAGDILVHCRDLIVFIMGRFGTPTELLAQTSVKQSRKFDILDWLRPVELMLRRLLMIEAIALAATLILKPTSAATQTPNPPQRPQPTPLDAENCEHWRACFSFALAPDQRTTPTHTRYHLPAMRGGLRARDRDVMHATTPLALRLEAAIRVALDPASAIKRLALRLKREAAPDIRRLLKGAPSRRFVVNQDLDRLRQAIEAALPPPPDSS